MFVKPISVNHVVTKITDYVGKKAALVSIAENTEIDIDRLIFELNASGIKFMGGIFPKVIHGQSISDTGIVVNTLVDVVMISHISQISKRKLVIPSIDFNENHQYSLITYVDGLTSNISSYLSELYEKYGMQTSYFGGGAGSLSLQQKPCVFTNDGIFQDSAVMCVMRMKMSIGVKHGWEKLKGPYIVTKAQSNTIQEINWKRPFEIYREAVESDSKKKFNDDNFFEIAKGYPFGIVRSGDEHVIRDPLTVNENGELVCVGQVEENTLVSIMKGNKDSLIIAAEEAAIESMKKAINPKKAIIVDCISRILFLEEKFNLELNKITSVLRERSPNISISGALTLGEISSYGDGYLEFYNKTVVVGLFE